MPLNTKEILLARQSLRLTQVQVARRAGLTQPMYSKIETGDRINPVLSTVERIAEALGRSIDSIVTPPAARKPKAADDGTKTVCEQRSGRRA